jgi:hypothetical protein
MMMTGTGRLSGHHGQWYIQLIERRCGPELAVQSGRHCDRAQPPTCKTRQQGQEAENGEHAKGLLAVGC